MGGLNFKHRPAISLHLPQCTFVCTFVSEMREHGCLITQGQLSDTLGALSPHVLYEKSLLPGCWVGEPQFANYIWAACERTKAAEGKASWTVHTVLLRHVWGITFFFWCFWAPGLACLAWFRPFCSLKVKDKSKWKCHLNGFWINSLITPPRHPMFFIKVTPKKIELSPMRKDVTFCLNMWKMSGVLSVSPQAMDSLACKWALFPGHHCWVENESHTHGKNGTIFFCLALYAVAEFVLMGILIVSFFEASY